MTNPFNSRISGLRLSVDVDGLTVRVGPGSAYVPESRRISTDTDLTTTLVAPAASQWRHIYLYLASDVPTVEAVTTLPAAPYQGTARLKTGDATRRYLGSIYVGTDNKLTPIRHESPGQYANRIVYLVPNGIVNTYVALILNGVLQTATTVSAAALAPPTVRLLSVNIDNSATLPCYFSNPDMGTVSATNHLRYVKAGGQFPADLLLDSSQQFSYVFGPGLIALGFINVRALSYLFDR